MKKTVLISFFLLSVSLSLNLYQTRSNIPSNSDISYSELFFVINNLDLKYKDIVFAQALIESGHFKSDLFIKNQNLFGMRFPKKRQTTAIDEENGYACYTTWIDSVEDYKLWQQAILKNKSVTKEEYLAILGDVYAEAPNYTTVIKKIIL